MYRTLTIAAVAAFLGLGAAAEASSFGKPCTNVPEAQWLALEALKAKVVEQGFTVEKAKLKRDCAELYARDKTGTRVELYVDPATGTIVGSEDD